MGFRDETAAAQARAAALQRELADKDAELARARAKIERLERRQAKLVVIDGELRGTTFELDGEALIIGRTDDVDITIPHRSLSRHHARLTRQGEGWTVQDLQSANGVQLDGKEVHEAPLRPGSVIRLGKVSLRFVAAGDSSEVLTVADEPGAAGRSVPIAVGVIVLIAAVAAVVLLI